MHDERNYCKLFCTVDKRCVMREKCREKEFELQGCVIVPCELTEDEFLDKFISFIEENGWYFGGGIKTIIDDL